MAPNKTYLDLCGNSTNDPVDTPAGRIQYATSTAARYDTTSLNSKDEDLMLVEALTNLGPTAGMNGSLIVFVEETDQLGGTLQVIHNIAPNPRDNHRNVVFAYYNDVEEGEVETIPFLKSVLADTDEVNVPQTTARLNQLYTTTETLKLVSLFADGDPFTKKITTHNATFVPFSLIPHLIGQNLTPKAVLRILVPVMATLSLELPTLTDFLLAACTKTTDNNPPVTVLDKAEMGMEHGLQRIFKVSAMLKKHILYHQLPALHQGGADLGNAVTFVNIAASTEGMRQAFVQNTSQRRLNIAARNRPTTVGEQYLNNLDCIIKICNVDSEDDLSPIWQMMANFRRDGEPLATLIKTQAGIEADYIEHTPLSISVPVELSLKNFKLGGNDNTSNIDSGIFPFMVTPSGATSTEAIYRQDAEDNAMLDYGMVSELTNSLLLSDARLI